MTETIKKLIVTDPASADPARSYDGRIALFNTNGEFIDLASSTEFNTLDNWNSARDNSFDSPGVDVVIFGDSISVLGSQIVKPFPHLLAKSLSAFETRAETYGHIFALGSHLVPDFDSCGGVAYAHGFGGYSSTMAVNDTAQVICSCDGITVIWTGAPSGGSIEVRDGGSGGTLVDTIDTTSATGASQITTIDFGSYASRTVHLKCVSASVIFEGAYMHSGDQGYGIRVWTGGHAGLTTADFISDSSLALDFIANQHSDLAIVATGYNDVSAEAYEEDLRTIIDMIRTNALPPIDVAIMVPWGGNNQVVAKAKADAAARVASDLECALFDVYGAVGSVGGNIDPWDQSSDGAHPRAGASMLISDVILRGLMPDPGLVDAAAFERGPRDLYGSLTVDFGSDGSAVINSLYGYPVLSLYEAMGEANPSFCVINAKLAALLSLPGSALGFGVGGASAMDTYLYRSAAGTLKTASLSLTGSLTLADASNIIAGTTTGTKIGTANTQKIGLWNTTPIVQPTTSITAATFAANTSGIANDTATYDGYTVGKVVKALRNFGLLQ